VLHGHCHLRNLHLQPLLFEDRSEEGHYDRLFVSRILSGLADCQQGGVKFYGDQDDSDRLHRSGFSSDNLRFCSRRWRRNDWFLKFGEIFGNALGPLMATSVLAYSNLLTLYIAIAGFTLVTLWAFLASREGFDPSPARYPFHPFLT